MHTTALKILSTVLQKNVYLDLNEYITKRILRSSFSIKIVKTVLHVLQFALIVSKLLVTV